MLKPSVKLLPSDAVYAVAWSSRHPDLVATGGGDDMAFIWRVMQLTLP